MGPLVYVSHRSQSQKIQNGSTSRLENGRDLCEGQRQVAIPLQSSRLQRANGRLLAQSQERQEGSHELFQKSY